MSDTETLIRVAKVQAWERAKGELQAMSQAAAFLRLSDQPKALRDEHSDRWARLDALIEEFIEAVEKDGLNE